MNDIYLPVALRLLPSLILLGLAFIAAADRRTREQWAMLLYQIGNIRPDQRDDPTIQQGVKKPFLILSALLLIWPIYQYIFLTKPVEITSDVYKRTPTPQSIYNRDASSATNPAVGSANGTPNGTPPATPNGTPAPNTTPAPVTQHTNIYGTPLP